MIIIPLFLALTAAPVDAPSRQPQLAAGFGKVAMTFGAGSSIYFSLSTDQGRSFSPPVKVAEPGALALGRHRGPRIAILKDSIVITAVVGEKKSEDAHAHGLPEAGNLIAWRSANDGKTWTRAANVNDVPGAAREGLHAMVVRPDGSLFAAWLDLREKGTHLYGSSSKNGGLTWSKNTMVYESPSGTICQCCHPSLTVDENGTIWLMWRNAVNGTRDLYVMSSTDGEHFSPARKLGSGTWKLDACPMDGGGLSVKEGVVTSAWRRENQIYLATGDDEKLVGEGKDVALIQTKTGPIMAWTKDGGIQVNASGKSSTITGDGGFPSLLALPDGSAVLAWETKTSIETRKLP